MTRAKNSRRIVTDADVARAAGGADARHPSARACRDFLMRMLQICHRCAMTPELLDEWRRHQSRYARRWLTQMFARKKVVIINSHRDQQFRERVFRTVPRQSDHILLS